MRNLIAGALALAVSLPASAQVVAPFARPLHIQRTIHDPISGSVSAIDEYYVGHQVVAVRGERIAIIDHQKRTLTEIDRARARWSESALSTSTSTAEVRQPKVRAQSSDADGTIHVAVEDHEIASLAVDLDRNVRLSRRALSMILGDSSPGATQRIISDAASAGDDASFLPSRIERTFEVAGETLVLVEELRFIAWEGPPAELLRLPEGATRETARSERLEQVRAEIEEPHQ